MLILIKGSQVNVPNITIVRESPEKRARSPINEATLRKRCKVSEAVALSDAMSGVDSVPPAAAAPPVAVAPPVAEGTPPPAPLIVKQVPQRDGMEATV